MMFWRNICKKSSLNDRDEYSFRFLMQKSNEHSNNITNEKSYGFAYYLSHWLSVRFRLSVSLPSTTSNGMTEIRYKGKGYLALNVAVNYMI